MSPEEKLAELDITLPEPPTPGGNYLSYRRTGNTLILAGVISFDSTGQQWTGQIGVERSLEDGYAAAKVCGLNVLATIRQITGSLDAIEQFLYVGGYVNALPGYGQSPSVINGASDLFRSSVNPGAMPVRWSRSRVCRKTPRSRFRSRWNSKREFNAANPRCSMRLFNESFGRAIGPNRRASAQMM